MVDKYLLIWLVVTNFVLFVLMYSDKQRARKRKYRISEKYLLILGLIGGGLGGVLGMQVFRHKTKHRYFYLIYLMGIAIWSWIIIKGIK